MSQLQQQPIKREIQPCNFRSAGRLSNESARTLTHLHETLARNLVNSLDVYLGTGLEVKLAGLDHLPIEEFRTACLSSGFILPCAVRPSSSTVLIEISNGLMFTITDLLLGGLGSTPVEARELTEIDEEIMQGVGALVADQVERVWKAVGFTLEPGASVKTAQAHRLFPPMEKVLRLRLDVFVADMVGALYLVFPASMGSNLVRNAKTDSLGSKSNVSYFAMSPLQERILECRFELIGELPQLSVPVRDLAAIQVGSLLKFSSPVTVAGKMTLEGCPFYNVALVQQDSNKAVQLLDALTPQRR